MLSGMVFHSRGAATEKRRAAMSMLCGGTRSKSLEAERSVRVCEYGLSIVTYKLRLLMILLYLVYIDLVPLCRRSGIQLCFFS